MTTIILKAMFSMQYLFSVIVKVIENMYEVGKYKKCIFKAHGKIAQYVRLRDRVALLLPQFFL